MRKIWDMSKIAQNDDIIVDMGLRRGKLTSIPATPKRRAMKAISNSINGLKDGVPLDEMFQSLENEGIIAVNEDGTRWSGFLLGRAECGSDDTNDQNVSIDLAMDNRDGTFSMTRSNLYITWCAKYSDNQFLGLDIVAYVT